MNANTIFTVNLSRIAVIACGLTLALPVMAQQDATQGLPMQGMQMPQPASSSSTPAPASSAQSTQGMQMQIPTPKPTKQKAHTTAAPAPASSAENMQGMDMSSMHGMHMQPPQASEIQHLHFGNMTGTRPRPAGLAGSSHGMEMSSMQNMDMSSMQGGKAPPDARSPDYSDGRRYTDMPGMAMADHAKVGMLLIDQLEYAHGNHGKDAAFLDAEAWYGEDFNKLWLKAEGRLGGEFRTEVLWNHAISSYWATQLGLRQDLGEGPRRTWAAFGVQGLAPFWFDTEATVYLGQNGRAAARVEFEYEELLTQRLVLQPKFEMNLYGKDDLQRGIGSGLSDAELGVRLRYEFKREFAPYIGVVWRQRYGRTADFARAQGEHAGELQFVAGLHFWLE